MIATTDPMDVHIFKSQSEGDLYGFTPEPSGDNLPADRGPWAPWSDRGSIQIFEDHPRPRIGINEADILAAIKSQGFYLINARIEARQTPEAE
jgi:hypothetical protein